MLNFKSNIRALATGWARKTCLMSVGHQKTSRMSFFMRVHQVRYGTA